MQCKYCRRKEHELEWEKFKSVPLCYHKKKVQKKVHNKSQVRTKGLCSCCGKLHITEKDIQLLVYLSKSYTYARIDLRFGRTCKGRVHLLLKHFNVHSRTALVIEAYKQGYIIFDSYVDNNGETNTNTRD